MPQDGRADPGGDVQGPQVVRQSLSSGRTSLVRWSGMASVLPALFSLVFALRCLGDSLSRTLGETGDLFLALVTAVLTTDSALGFFALLGFASAGYFFRKAVRARRDIATPAADIVIEQTRFTVLGGPHDGLSLEWSELDPDGLALDVPEWLELKNAGIVDHARDAPRPPASLKVRAKDGRTVLIGITRSSEDLDSLWALHELFSNRLSPSSEVPPPPVAIRCGHCGVAVLPSFEARTSCTHCQGEVLVPADIRSRLGALEQMEMPDAVHAARHRLDGHPAGVGEDLVVGKSQVVEQKGERRLARPQTKCPQAKERLVFSGVIGNGIEATMYYSVGGVCVCVEGFPSTVSR